MQTVKTAISIEKTLFEQAELFAHKMKLSRSKLFVMALQDFFKHQKNKELLAQINAAYSDEPDSAEQKLRMRLRQQHRRTIREEW